MTNCNLCPRNCFADRTVPAPAGFCRMGADMRMVRAAPHFWEEPCISGTRGSGTIFFAGCTERCVYCQNRSISHVAHAANAPGKTVSPEEMSDIMLSLQGEGVHNINLVTPTHFANRIADAIRIAKNRGLSVPVVYNTGGYEKPKTLRMLDGLVDIYLTDFQHASHEKSSRYSAVPDYPEIAKTALREMARQTKRVVFEDGMTPGEYDTLCSLQSEADDYTGPLMVRGMIVRHLVLPGETEDSLRVLDILRAFADEAGEESFYLSIMNQYTPMLSAEDAKRYPALTRPLCAEAYETVIRAAEALHFPHVFFQYGDTASESFIPPF